MKKAAESVFDYDNAIVSIAQDIITNGDLKEDKNYPLIDFLRDEIIWDDDRWAIMKHYQRPEEANFEEALEAFKNDLLKVYELYNK